MAITGHSVSGAGVRWTRPECFDAQRLKCERYPSATLRPWAGDSPSFSLLVCKARLIMATSEYLFICFNKSFHSTMDFRQNVKIHTSEVQINKEFKVKGKPE